jgi:hypothetical protein
MANYIEQIISHIPMTLATHCSNVLIQEFMDTKNVTGEDVTPHGVIKHAARCRRHKLSKGLEQQLVLDVKLAMVFSPAIINGILFIIHMKAWGQSNVNKAPPTKVINTTSGGFFGTITIQGKRDFGFVEVVLAVDGMVVPPDIIIKHLREYYLPLGIDLDAATCGPDTSVHQKICGIRMVAVIEFFQNQVTKQPSLPVEVAFFEPLKDVQGIDFDDHISVYIFQCYYQWLNRRRKCDCYQMLLEEKNFEVTSQSLYTISTLTCPCNSGPPECYGSVSIGNDNKRICQNY